VEFTDPNPPDIPANQLHRFAFTSSDLDSDPDSLEYQWSFDNEPFTDPVVKDPDALYVEEDFSEIGFHTLVLRAVDPDPDVPLGRSIPDTVGFNVIPPRDGT
jgi:hypothetical protein